MSEPNEILQMEAAAFRVLRSLPGPSYGWGQMINAAQLTLAEESRRIRGEPRIVLDPPQTAKVVAAARVLDVAAQVFEPSREREAVAELAMLAYAVHGNLTAATAVYRRQLRPIATRDDPWSAVVAAIAAPVSLGDVLSSPAGNDSATLLENINHLTFENTSAELRTLTGQLIEAMQTAQTPHQVVRLGHALTVLSVRDVLSLRQHAGELQLSADQVQGLQRAHIHSLLPPQARAVESGLYSTHRNAAVLLPTSTGKTLLGEFMLLRELSAGPGLGVYVVPYIALGSQVAKAIRRHIGDPVRVTPLVGGYQPEQPFEPTTEREVVVATPERLDSLLRTSPELSSHLRTVVIDEAHQIGNGHRGALLEGLITRLRLLQERGNRFRLMLLSAVVDTVDEVTEWLGNDATTFSDSWQPTARRLGVWLASGQITWFAGNDVIATSTREPDQVLGTTTLPWPHGHFYPTDNFGAQRKQKGDVNKNAAYFLRYLHQTYNEPVLALCATRGDTRRVAVELAELVGETPVLPEHSQDLVDRINVKFSHLRPLSYCIRHGVAFHNASLPADIRALVESAAEAQELVAVISTTTLAEGIDLPFRFTVLVDWLAWGQPISPLLFANMAGRSGRAGFHTEGDMIVIDNPVGDRRFTAPQYRYGFLRRVLGFEEPRTLASVLSLQSSDRTIHATMASQILAAVPENESEEDLASHFVDHTFVAAHAPEEDVEELRRGVRSVVTELEAGEALATAASPLTLTPIGRSVVTTGLSPGTARGLLDVLRDMPQDVAENAIEALSYLLLGTGMAPEQPIDKFASIIEGRSKIQFPVKRSDVSDIIGGWLAGLPEEELFIDLPYVQRSRRAESIDRWLAGLDLRSSWQDEFDKFTDFLTATLGSFLPWLCRAAAAVSNHVDAPAQHAPWLRLGDMVSVGVDTPWAVRAIEMGAPGGRTLLAPLGRGVQSHAPAGIELEPGMEPLFGIEPVDILTDVLDEIGLDTVERDPDISQLRRWLARRGATS